MTKTLNGTDHEIKSYRKDELNEVTVYNREQAMALVGTYYSIQKVRVGSSNKISAHERQVDILADTALMGHIKSDLQKLENQIKRGLKLYAESHTVGQWALSQVGVGPVICAGLMAHIDLERAVTVGNILSFAGLVKGQVWLGRAASAKVVKGIVNTTKKDTLTPEEFVEVAYGMDACPKWLCRRVFRVLHKSEPPFRHLARIDDLVYVRETFGEVHPTLAQVVDAVTVRPWNTALKTLLYKLGESFKKTCNHPNTFYGKFYKERKLIEEDKNVKGAYQALAVKMLEDRKNSRISAEQKKVWGSGKLQARGLDFIAMRFATNLFLSHYHQVGREALGLFVPRPYAVEHAGHAHVIPAPNWVAGKVVGGKDSDVVED